MRLQAMWSDGRTDKQADRQGDSYMPPKTMFVGGIINRVFYCANILSIRNG